MTKSKLHGDPFAANPYVWRSLLAVVLKKVGPQTIKLSDLDEDWSIAAMTEDTERPTDSVTLSYLAGHPDENEEKLVNMVRVAVRNSADGNAVEMTKIMMDDADELLPAVREITVEVDVCDDQGD